MKKLVSVAKDLAHNLLDRESVYNKFDRRSFEYRRIKELMSYNDEERIRVGIEFDMNPAMIFVSLGKLEEMKTLFNFSNN